MLFFIQLGPHLRERIRQLLVARLMSHHLPAECAVIVLCAALLTANFTARGYQSPMWLHIDTGVLSHGACLLPASQYKSSGRRGYPDQAWCP